MPSLSEITWCLSLFPLLSAGNNFAPDGFWLNINSKVDIWEARGSIILPELPFPVTGFATLWLGLETTKQGKADFYQPLLYSGPAGDLHCAGDSWCAKAFVQHPDGSGTSGEVLQIMPGTKVTSHFIIDAEKNVETTIEVGGEVVSSTVTKLDLPIVNFYSAVECHTAPAGMIGGGNCSLARHSLEALETGSRSEGTQSHLRWFLHIGWWADMDLS